LLASAGVIGLWGIGFFSIDLNRTIVRNQAEQQAREGAAPVLEPTPLWRRIVFSSLFFLAVAGALGGAAGWALLEPYMNESTTLRGEIEETELASVMFLEGGQFLIVRGQRILVHEDITQVEGRGQYADTDEVDELRKGLPIRAIVWVEGSESGVVLAEYIIVEEIPPEHADDPLPDFREIAKGSLLSGIFGFAIVGACIAGFIAAADGFMSRNIRRGLLSGACGVGIAGGGGLVGLIPAGVAFSLSVALVTATAEGMWSSNTVSGIPLLVLMVGRSLTWGILGLTVGLGPGAAMRSKKLLLNGLLGGMLGGILGGLLFDPICQLFNNPEWMAQGIASRGVGFSVIGLSAGFMIGLVEHLSKDAWLLMRAGPLTGKQFVVYKSPTALGSSPKCEIYLFKDPQVEPRHALLHRTGNRYEIEDLNSPAGTYVNGERIKRRSLADGDQIAIGDTVLEYAERPRGST